MTDRLFLLLAAVFLAPIALSYGVAPTKTVTYLLGFPVESTNHVHVFRAIMGLYLANMAFWIAGAVLPSLRVPALWTLFIFAGGLAAGRILSLIMDGFPSLVLVLYLVAELAFAALAFRFLRQTGQAG